MAGKKILVALIAIIISIAAVFIYLNFFGPASPSLGGPGQRGTAVENFIVPMKAASPDISAKLKSEGFIKSEWLFNLAGRIKGAGKIKPGGYKISKSMDVWTIISTLSKAPYLKWVIIPEGLRKEEIADILSSQLLWSNAAKENWLKKDAAANPDYLEGVYFPDTYLIPSDESPAEVANRLRKHFEEKFSPHSQEARKQNIKWATVIKVASLIQREAAGANDMPIISGIIWNRLLSGMKLDLDATIQYSRGNIGQGWWAPITIDDKKIDSAYNTYLHKGLPLGPICNPGLDAIKAALFPAKTDYLYYLHDAAGKIHCARTYEEHQQNIKKYLR